MIKLAKKLDFYDDPEGEVLKKRFSGAQDIPQIFKEGSILTPEEREKTPDNLFALVIQDNGSKLRKFACTDKANTALSVMYFLDNAKDKMPDMLQKVAARNLELACGWYGITPPAVLTKIAAGGKHTHIQPFVKASDVVQDVVVEKHADYCLPTQKKYPIHSYRQITQAIDYFDKYAEKFDPDTRRTYCRNLEKKASELGLSLPESVRHYSSTSPANSLHVKEQLASRMSKVSSAHMNAYRSLASKIDSLDRDVFAIALEKLDKVAGMDSLWDETIEDPWKTCFTLPKQAAYTFNDTTGFVTDVDLKKLTEFRTLLERTFDNDLVDNFCKDPVATFEALPLDQKRVVIEFAKTIRKEGNV